MDVGIKIGSCPTMIMLKLIEKGDQHYVTFPNLTIRDRPFNY